MNKLVIIIFIVLNGTFCFSQTTYKYKPFKSYDYPSNKYKILTDTASFSKFKIKIIKIHPINNQYTDSTFFYCRVWLTVKQGKKTIIQKYYKSIEPVGGCSGLFIPENQQRKDYFIISKFGDYDGSILILDTTGRITEKIGGSFYISKNRQYLFSNYDSDAEGLTVYDFKNNRVLYSKMESILYRLGDWYFQDGMYFAIAYDENSEEKEQQQNIKIATFDFKRNKLVITTVDKLYMKDKNKLKLYNDFEHDEKCNCGS